MLAVVQRKVELLTLKFFLLSVVHCASASEHRRTFGRNPEADVAPSGLRPADELRVAALLSLSSEKSRFRLAPIAPER